MVAHLMSISAGDQAQRRVVRAETAARALTTMRLGMELLSASPCAELSALDRSLLIRAIAQATEQLTDATASVLAERRAGAARA